MALTLSTAVKDKVSQLLFNAPYAQASTYYQSLIDGEGASALIHMEMLAQWFTYTTGTGAAPDAWEPWFVTEICWRVSQNTHPERHESFRRQRLQLQKEAIQSFSPDAMNVTPSGSEAFVFTVLNNRRYVLSHTGALNPPLYPKPHAIDAALNEAMTLVWNKANWVFRRRPARMKITRHAFTDGVWTAATRTISGLSGVGTSLPAGTRVYITGGANAVPGDHVIASTTASTIVTDTDIGAENADNDIGGFYYTVSFEGMQPGEAFDSVASGRLMSAGGLTDGSWVSWLPADDFASACAAGVGVPGRPRFFRVHQPSKASAAFLFWPPPDADYEYRLEVLARQPASPASGSDTGPFDAFAAEFMPLVRRLQLDRVLTNHGRTNGQLHAEVMDEMESLLPVYQSAGEPPRRGGVPDRYGDIAELTGGGYEIGGPL